MSTPTLYEGSVYGTGRLRGLDHGGRRRTVWIACYTYARATRRPSTLRMITVGCRATAIRRKLFLLARTSQDPGPPFEFRGFRASHFASRAMWCRAHRTRARGTYVVPRRHARDITVGWWSWREGVCTDLGPMYIEDEEGIVGETGEPQDERRQADALLGNKQN